MFQFLKNKPKWAFWGKSDFPASGMMPYMMHWNQFSVLTNKNELVQVVKLRGFSFETADDEDLDIKKDMRNIMLKGLAGSDIGVYTHIIRRRQKAYPDDYESISMPEGFPLYLDKKWVDKHKKQEAYVNEMYISVIKPVAKVGKVDKLNDLMAGKDETSSEFVIYKEAYELLEEMTGRIMSSLKDYEPELMGIEESKEGYFSQILEFFSTIVNCGESSKILVPIGNMSKHLSNNRIYFGKRAFEIKYRNGEKKYGGIVSIKEYGPKSWAGMLDGFLQQPFEFIITQSFTFQNRQSAIYNMQLQQNRMIQAEDRGLSQIADISVAIDKALSGEIAFGRHHLTVMCMADSMKQLDNYLSQAAVELSNTGGIGARESSNLEPCFWAQLPGNNDYIIRKATINSYNLAGLSSFHNYPFGKEKGNHWGDAVTILDTTSGTPFYFNFHVRDVGHTTIIGPTGAGKTVLMNFLCAQAQKFKCRLFFFDKDRGAEIFIRALGGKYTIIDPGKQCGFNPLQLPDTGENRTFLTDWFKQLISVNGEMVTAEDIGMINSAINGNYKLDLRDRKLSNIAPFFGLAGPGTVAGRLAMWMGKGSHARLFDNDIDVIDFAKDNIFGFEMGELLKDKASLGPSLSYIFHKINLSLDGTPTMIVLDEAWALIDNPIFAPKIKDWLKVLRKLNTFVVFATQSVEDASKSSISDTLIQQTATQIFLPNLKATSVYKTTFMLSEREFQLVKTTDPGTRFFLVKQGTSSVVARIDLSGMGDVINILSGRASTVAILDEVRKTYGDDPNIWIPIFDKKVQEASEA